MALYPELPVRYDHTLIIGDTYSGAAVFKEDDGTPRDLTGATGVATLARDGATILSPTVSIAAPTTGAFVWTSAAGDTDDLQPGDAYLAVVLTFSDGVVKTLVDGLVQVVRRRLWGR